MNKKLREKFYGLSDIYNKAANNINIIKENTDYSLEGKQNKIRAIRNEFYTNYGQRVNEAREECQELIKSAVRNNRISKFKKSDNITLDIERYRQLESMGIGALVEYLSKDNNVYNEVFMNLFELKADYYINNFDFKKDTGYDQIRALIGELNGDNSEEVKSLRDDLVRLNNADTSLKSFDRLDTFTEDENYQNVDITDYFYTEGEKEGRVKGRYTMYQTVSDPGEESKSDFEFNFKGVRSRE